MPLSDLFPASRLGAMADQLARFAAGFGVTGMKQSGRLPNTRRALAVAELAREQGKLDAFRAAAMKAHWREGRDLEKDADLRAIAAEAGLEPDAAIAAADDPRFQERIDAVRAEASAAGVTGIPTFFFGGLRVVGCQSYEVLAEAARRAGASSRAGS